MNNEDFKRIILKFSKVADEISDIKDSDMLIDDLAIDSLSFIELVIRLEEKYNIDLKTDMSLFSRDLTVGELYKKIIVN
ncbi:acyl carrier protein [Ligilactobacillus apodemi]|uniref:acyl carrier protein n=1 Tax=Ligilactobacillus apodemi TaxID=307126 RepID=UPI00214AE2C3|nr:phosphopantetheine-binding protein [Ligilactobacillus apodemi]MCR1901402.1 phosphopantetheine-binding protein [Ligilactobacillus apodemi]